MPYFVAVEPATTAVINEFESEEQNLWLQTLITANAHWNTSMGRSVVKENLLSPEIYVVYLIEEPFSPFLAEGFLMALLIFIILFL